ncbi:unnamed protein product, partial [Ectocarpus sp. 12 AP-2014]
MHWSNPPGLGGDGGGSVRVTRMFLDLASIKAHDTPVLERHGPPWLSCPFQLGHSHSLSRRALRSGEGFVNTVNTETRCFRGETVMGRLMGTFCTCRGCIGRRYGDGACVPRGKGRGGRERHVQKGKRE